MYHLSQCKFSPNFDVLKLTGWSLQSIYLFALCASIGISSTSTDPTPRSGSAKWIVVPMFMIVLTIWPMPNPVSMSEPWIF